MRFMVGRYEVHVVNDDVVEDDGDGDGFGKVFGKDVPKISKRSWWEETMKWEGSKASRFLIWFCGVHKSS